MFITDPHLPVNERIKQLDIRESKILDDIKGLDLSLRDTQNRIQEILHDWSLVIEEQHVLGSYMKPVNTICSRIIQILKENNLDELTKYTYNLPDRFKQLKYQHAGLFGAAYKNTPFKSADDVVQSELDNYRELEKEEYVKNMLSSERKFPVFLPANTPLDGMTKDEIRRRYELIKEAKSRLREEMSNLEESIKLNNIALVEEKLEEHISTDKPEARETEFSQAIGSTIFELNKLVSTLEQLKEKVYQFPPNDDDAAPYTIGFNEFMSELIKGINRFIQPIKDEKWTNSWSNWFQTANLEYDHGKHAAGKMSAAPSHKGIMRPMTREIVGDSRDKVFNQALEFVKMVSMFDQLTDYHEKYIRPRILDRKIRLSPKLSEQA
jgi:hypothetical protein